DRDEQISVERVGARGAQIEGNEAVRVSREQRVHLELMRQERGHGPRDVERDFFLAKPRGTDSAVVVAAVAGVDGDAMDLALATGLLFVDRRPRAYVDDDSERVGQVEDALVERAGEIENDPRSVALRSLTNAPDRAADLDLVRYALRARAGDV